MRRCALTIVLALLSCPLAAAEEKHVIGYFAEWSDPKKYGAADIPAALLTHVNYAFAVIRDGKCAINDASDVTSPTLSTTISSSRRSFPSACGSTTKFTSPTFPQ